MLIVIFSSLNMQQHKPQKGMHLPQIIKCAEMWTCGISKEPSKYQPSLILKKSWDVGRKKGERGGHHGGNTILISIA